MLYFGLLLITMVMAVVAAIFGRRLSALLPGALQPAGRFYFAPLLGLSALVLVATLHGWFVPFTLWNTAGLVGVALPLCLWFEPNRRALIRDLLVLAGFVAVASSTVLMPLLRYDAYNPFNDTFTYLVHSQWLQTHAFSEPVVYSGYFPALTQVHQYQTAGHRMGGSFFLAFAQAAFALKWSYYAYPAVAALMLAAGSLAVAGTVQLILPCRRRTALLIAAATATMMNGFAFGSFYGFMPQTFGLAFAVGGLGLFGGLAIRHLGAVGGRTVMVQTLPAALLFAALSFCYNDMLPFIAVGMVIFLGAMAVFDRRHLLRMLFCTLVLALETGIIINYEFVRIYKNFVDTVLNVGGGNAAIGWPVRWSPLEFLANTVGFKSPIDGFWLLGDPGLTMVVCIGFVAAVVAVTALVCRRERSTALGLNLGVIAVFVMAFLHFRYHVPTVWPDDVGHSFLQFKTAKWVSPFMFVLVGVTVAWFSGLDSWWSGAGRLTDAVVAAVVAVAIGWNYKAATTLTTQLLDETGYRTSSFNAFLDLRQLVSSIPPDRPIYVNLGSEHHKMRQMVAYVLQDRRLASNYWDDGYLTGNIPPDQREMPLELADWVIARASAGDITGKTQPLVGTLVLKSSAAQQFNLDRVDGGYALEVDGINSWRWAAGSIAYHYRVLGKPRSVRVHFSYLPAGSPRHLRVTVSDGNGVNLGTSDVTMSGGWGKFVSPPITIGTRDVVIRLQSDGITGPLSPGDPRVVSFLIQNLEFWDADK